MYTYSQVESALARVHRIPASSLGAFRGRIKHLARLGLVPRSPGKGKKISYEKIDVYKWALALEFGQFGIDPTVIKLFIETHWRSILSDLDASPDKYLFFHPCFLGKSFPKTEQESFYTPRNGVPSPILAKVIVDLSELDQMATNAMARAAIEEDKSRYGMINLGHLHRKVENALAAVSA
jgi:hypothetical protein